MYYGSGSTHGGDIYGFSEGDGRRAVLDFSVNLSPLGVPAGVTEAMRDAALKAGQYPDPHCRDLLRALSEFEEVPSSRVLCGNGAAELIYAFCHALHPASAAVMAPTFSEYEAAFFGSGGASANLYRYDLREENGFLPGRNLLDFLESLRPEVLFLCNPNNPTGRLMPTELLLETAAFCERHNIRLFLDECFLDFTEGGISLKPDLEKYRGLLILKAFTKNFGIAGARLGYCLSADTELLGKMAAAVQPWNISVFAQAAGIAAAKERDYPARARELIRKERAFLCTGLEAAGFKVMPSDANFLLFKGPADLDAQLRRRGILIRSCSRERGLGSGWYRAAVRLHDENAELLEAVSESRQSHFP